MELAVNEQALRAAIEPARGGSGSHRSEACRVRRLKRGAGAPFLKILVYFCTGITLFCILFMLGYILIKGIPYLRASLFSWNYTSENCSVVPALVNTLIMTLLSLLIAGPLGIGSAIYLVEYAKKGNRFVKIVRMTAETLTGIPSIIYGLFGMLLFVGYLKWGYSMMAGAATLSIMILPTIMRTTEEALLAVPTSFREGSFGLGAGKLRTIFRIVLPSAVPGILSGIILATGRVVGETAALIYTAGTVAQIPENLFGSGRTLAIHMYVLSSEGLHTGQAFATALVLLVMVGGINAVAGLVARRIGK
ncbi:MAG: phosphate ABC transporter permease PstA [Treponema sp.]|nr:phosphate ABC transporter permease PstA [Treponema sp.]